VAGLPKAANSARENGLPSPSTRGATHRQCKALCVAYAERLDHAVRRTRLDRKLRPQAIDAWLWSEFTWIRSLAASERSTPPGSSVTS